MKYVLLQGVAGSSLRPKMCFHALYRARTELTLINSCVRVRGYHKADGEIHGRATRLLLWFSTWDVQGVAPHPATGSGGADPLNATFGTMKHVRDPLPFPLVSGSWFDKVMTKIGVETVCSGWEHEVEHGQPDYGSSLDQHRSSRDLGRKERTVWSGSCVAYHSQYCPWKSVTCQTGGGHVYSGAASQ